MSTACAIKVTKSMQEDKPSHLPHVNDDGAVLVVENVVLAEVGVHKPARIASLMSYGVSTKQTERCCACGA